jgi:hypothetical protein
MRKVLTIGLAIAIGAAAAAPAQAGGAAEPTTVERTIAQERGRHADLRLSRAALPQRGEATIVGRTILQERGRRADVQVLGASVERVSTPMAAAPRPLPGSGFDWGDAGVGAGATLAVLLLLGAAMLASRSRRVAHS